MKSIKKWKVIFVCICCIFLVVVSADARRRSRTTPTPTPGTVATATPTPEPTQPVETWVPYLPSAAQVNIVPERENGLIHVDITFSSSGFRVADPGIIAVGAGINPDGTTFLSNLTVGTKIERWTGMALMVITTERITYQIGYGDTTYFCFNVEYGGTNQKVKDITITK
ncbi:MAG: hypothetical protein JW969_13365 [Spirochaetales bacterium]|nr:hypothetical protein [Spirochaetales bacterium]